MCLNKRLLITIGYMGIALLVSSSAIPARQDAPAFNAKNLKVLPKHISREELDTIMDNFKDALGVKCGHCHAPQEANPRKLDFASDAKPEKATARKMIKMTARINKQYFRNSNGQAMIQVECRTCHRGDTRPEVKSSKSK